MSDVERLNRAIDTLTYLTENPSTIGSGNPQIYELLSVLFEAVRDLNEQLSMPQSAVPAARKSRKSDSQRKA
jgi:hypothetical protein